MLTRTTVDFDRLRPLTRIAELDPYIPSGTGLNCEACGEWLILRTGRTFSFPNIDGHTMAGPAFIDDEREALVIGCPFCFCWCVWPAVQKQEEE